MRRLRGRRRHALRPRAVPPVGAAQGAPGLRDAARLAVRHRHVRAGRGLPARGARLRALHRGARGRARSASSASAPTVPRPSCFPELREREFSSSARAGASTRWCGRCSASPGAPEVFAAPGNPGIADDRVVLPRRPADPAAVAQLADDLDADLVVVGPEGPLVAGVADAVRARGRLGVRARRGRRPARGLEGVDEGGARGRRRAHRAARDVRRRRRRPRARVPRRRCRRPTS